MIDILAGALAAGFFGSPHCAGMCGSFAVAVSDSPRGSVAWNAGRLATYAALGGVAGMAGEAVPGPAWVPSAVAAPFLVVFAWKLAGLPFPVVKTRAAERIARLGARLGARRGALARFAFGALTGLLPCGLVYAALALPLASGRPSVGALSMLAFGLGTAPALLVAGAGLRGIVARSLGARRFLAAAVLLVGVFSLVNRANRVSSVHSHHGSAGSPASGQHAH